MTLEKELRSYHGCEHPPDWALHIPSMLLNRLAMTRADGGLTEAARVLMALARVDRAAPLYLTDLYDAAGVGPKRGHLALLYLRWHGLIDGELALGRARQRYALSPLGLNIASRLDSHERPD